ncbi:leucine-rich repeat protein [Bacteroides sp. 51]|uniref:leucine-rich repeat protein n=1 Tax=Bacteroides sp. 51 TaxID=2302938 RepID=UPI0013D6871B|nr:leucine-rich repeat domain-containing protein [Bacteroides sp. 51]NDV83716.1 leucine-rich repeat domain-containing protein [Bacteroides sp. 51]
MGSKQLLFIGVALLANVFGATAQVSKTLYVDKAGSMISQITADEANKVTHLTLMGKINAVDFKSLRDGFPHLEMLDLANVDIKMYTGKAGTHADKFYVYPPNCIPAYAFSRLEGETLYGKQTLKKVILSEKIKNIEDGAFFGCSNLHICQINKKSAPNLLDNALSDTITAIFIPLGTRDEYRLKKRWENFAFIEGEPIEATFQVGAQGSLKAEIQAAGLQPNNINFLTVEGKLDADDLKLITDYMPNLVSVDISKTTATALPDFTFAQKKYMLRIKLPNGLKSIGQRVFSGCGRLSGMLILPPEVTTIDYGAFMGCESLKGVMVTGSKLTAVGDNLFGDSNGRLYYQNK